MQRGWWWFGLAALILIPGLAPAVPVTPSEARSLAVDAEQVVVSLNNNLVDNYFHKGEFMNAVEVLDRIITLNPLGIEPYADAAWLLWSSGKTPMAKLFYDRMIAANPDDPLGYYEVGVFYQRLKQNEDAVTWYARAVEHGLPSPENHAYAHALERVGRTQDALAFWKKILEKDPKDDVAPREITRLSTPVTPVEVVPDK